MANSLWPAYVVIEYTTLYGAHKQTIPTRTWDIAIGTHGFGGYLGWDLATPNEADDMITDLVTDLAAFCLSSTTFNVATVYQVNIPGGHSIPVTTISLSIVGTSTGTGQAKASQQTWNMRTDTFGKFKLVLLDQPVGSSFDKILPAAFGAADLAVVGAVTDLTKAWSGRDGRPPAAAISKTLTLNDKLRREYGMS